jgi:adenylate cyclase
MFKSHATRGFLICLGVTFLVLVLYMKNGLDPLELKAVDFRFKWRGERPVNQDIVVITIDDDSIDKLGRWPWPRATHAKLLKILHKAGAKVVAFDSLFTEPDKENPRSDLELAQAVKETGIVVSAFFFKGGIRETEGNDPLFPFPALAEYSRMGFVNLPPDQDGVTRRAALYAIDNEEAYPSLAVSALALSEKKTFEEFQNQVPIKFETETTMAENSLFINFADPRKSPTGYPYPKYSYADVLDGHIDPVKTFKGKIVLVGATATALFDLKAIPFVSIHPGVMIHANVIDNLIAENYITETSILFTLVYVFCLGILMGFLLPRVSPWIKLCVFTTLTVGGIGLGLWLFSAKNLVIPMVPPLFATLGCYLGILIYQLVVEEREKRKIKGSFKQYLSPKIIDILTKDPSKLKLGGEEREVSIFFLDIAGFTTMSEALKPTQLVEVMNNCLTEFSSVILKHDGLINKYIGDCIMAFWNAPADQPKHAAQACLAALDCIGVLPDMNRKFQEKGLPNIDCRVGVNTGTVVVGNMGSMEKFDYTVMGDPVNLASRLEGANKQYHTRIMISDVTFEKAREDIEARDLDLIRVKGKKEPRKVFEVLCRKGQMSEELTEGRKRYHQGLSLYRQQCFEDAVQHFETVFDYLPNDHVTRVYLERARAFISRPPLAGWDGVYEMTTK